MEFSGTSDTIEAAAARTRKGMDTELVMPNLQASAEFRERLLEMYTKCALHETSERVGTPAAVD
ncbi:hypothetical protein [Halegenticoccus tardaugens]|uniref:hypothetical protein n=1 Tax=Halegenticoccus tardaugens TaxID=2071624 RepID=UPI00100B7F04|nr:hypothetical protein [Halegenticoccus tardaugens]